MFSKLFNSVKARLLYLLCIILNVKKNNILYYSTYDNKTVMPSFLSYNPFNGAEILFNVIGQNGIGKLVFDRPLKKIGAYTFMHSSNLESVCIPDSVEIIDNYAFNNNTIYRFYGKFASSDNRSIIIDNKLVAIALFNYNNYTIPYNVTNIGTNFADVRKKTLTVEVNNQFVPKKDAFMNSYFQLITNMDNIPAETFRYNEFTNVVIGKNTKTIGDKAFLRTEGTWSYDTGERYKADMYCNVICMSEIPPVIGKNVFGGIAPGTDQDWEKTNFHYNKILVPVNSVNGYKNVWKSYASYIQAITID